MSFNIILMGFFGENRELNPFLSNKCINHLCVKYVYIKKINEGQSGPSTHTQIIFRHISLYKTTKRNQWDLTSVELKIPFMGAKVL